MRQISARRFFLVRLHFKSANIRIAQMSETLRVNHLLIKYFFVLICSLLFISCQSDAKQEVSALSGDKQAIAELSRINQILASGQPFAPADFESLKKIYEKYPDDTQIRNTFQSALVKREDWVSIEKFINRIPAAERTRADQLNLGKVYLKLGRFQELIDLMKPLAETAKGDTDFNALLGFGYFYAGQNDEAARYFDNVWEAIISEKRVDEITTRGMIYFRQNNFPKAIETFEKSLEINPQNSTATNILSRIYAAQSNSEKAEEFRRRTAEIHQRGEESEAKAMRQVSLYYDLQNAWKDKKYSEVIALANRILPEADEKNKPALYQYIAESNKALGKMPEAEAALKEMEKLKK